MSDLHSRRTLLSALVLGVAGFFNRGARAQTVKADKVLVYKARRTLELMRGDQVVDSFHIMLGEHPVGPKMKKSDGRTPEGFYVIDGRNPRSPYHLSLHLDYPNEVDKISSQMEDVVAGGDICIHGMPAKFGHTDPIGYFTDWTDGCISVGNKSIERIWDAVDIGTPVEIRA